jgi:hypothetical protein
MNVHAMMILEWLRTDTTDYQRGITAGVWMVRRYECEPWERMYVENIRNARRKGVPL